MVTLHLTSYEGPDLMLDKIMKHLLYNYRAINQNTYITVRHLQYIPQNMPMVWCNLILSSDILSANNDSLIDASCFTHMHEDCLIGGRAVINVHNLCDILQKFQKYYSK